MRAPLRLLRQRSFLPLFVTQFLGAFNDNLFKTVMILFVTFNLLGDPRQESSFNALATGLFVLPFFLLSALSGQLADHMDKAKIIRAVKLAEMGIMLLGAAGLLLCDTNPGAAIAMMLVAVLALGAHSTFFGPIKFAILPQHLDADDVLGGTGLIEASRYVAVLAGTIVAGWIDHRTAAGLVLAVAVLGYLAGRLVPPAPAQGPAFELDFNVVRAQWRLIGATMRVRKLFLTIMSISLVGMIATLLVIVFPPLVKHDFTASKEVASLFLAIFSIGVAMGSIAINGLLRGRISADYAPFSVLMMGAFIWYFQHVAGTWVPATGGSLYTVAEFFAQPQSGSVIVALFGMTFFGGMFVVPLYALLTTTTTKHEMARTVAASNVMKTGAMVIGALVMLAATRAGLSSRDALVLMAVLCIFSAALALVLQRCCDAQGELENNGSLS